MSAQATAPVDAIVPFWNRMPQMLAYPLKGASIAAIVLFGLGWLLLLLPGVLKLIGIVVFLVLMVAMLRFGFECLIATAEGYMDPPEIGRSEDKSLGWKYVGLLFVMGLLFGAVGAVFGPGGKIAANVLMGLCLPCATMTLAMDKTVGNALSPLKWASIFLAVGWPYLGLIGVCFAISQSEGWAQGQLAQFLPLPLALVAIGMVTNYTIVATFHLMGYMLYQYHEELGLTPEAPAVARAAAPMDPDQALLDEAATLVRDGKPEEAAERLRGRLRAGASPAVHSQYRKLLRIAGNRQALLDHGHEFIALLIDQDNDRAAVDLLRDCQHDDPAFVPDTALRIAKLAHMAARVGQQRAAVQVLEGFRDRYPNSQYLAQCHLLAAELLHEHLGQDEKACELLRYVKAHCPNDPLQLEIDAKLQAIERMIAATAKPGSRPAHS